MIDVIIPKKAFLPIYQPLLTSEHDINFLWGGRDAGRSDFVASRLIIDCLTMPKFRGVFIKKTANSIHDAQWQTVKDIVHRWGLQSQFRFKESPLSIECVNGGKFISRGCDDAENIKSIKDPTHVWYEEGNQLDLSDFITVATTLRSNDVQIQQWFCFNPEARGDYEEFWLYKMFFKGKGYTFQSEWVIEIPNEDPVRFTINSTHATYKNNRYCTPQRIAFLEQLAIINPYYYKVYTQGEWGNESTASPFVYTFDRGKHAGANTWQPMLDTYLSFDFNINPITCGVYQHYNDKIKGIESIKLENSNIYKLCEYIKVHYPRGLFWVTGDATGKNSTALVKDNVNYYTVIKNELDLSSAQFKVPSVNPPIVENRMLVNTAFHKADILLDEYKCRHLIFDCENVSVTPEGTIDKGDRKNPKKQADHLDHFRYYLNTFHRSLLKV
jgi:PBSX family phage terminase large subunit